jgi:predicted nucleic acid-binding protein
MIAVSDTTPLRYLIAVRHETLLEKLFEKVFIPDAVYEELTDAKTPETVRRRMFPLPAWLEVHAVSQIPAIEFPIRLHRGEREAILLAETLKPDLLLMDEQTGRSIALSRGLSLSGTLGVMEAADTAGLVTSFPEVLRELKASGFFFAESLEQVLLQRHGARRLLPEGK